MGEQKPILSEEEREVLWVAGFTNHGIKPGKFEFHLIKAMLLSDLSTFMSFKEVFPRIWEAVDAFRYGDIFINIGKGEILLLRRGKNES